MKIRSGFVSNSSSCSFVLIGCRFDKDKVRDEDIYKAYFPDKEFVEDFYDDFYDKGFYFADDIYGGAPDNEIILGKIIDETDETGLFYDGSFVRYNDIAQMMVGMCDKLNEHNIEYKDFGVFIGNRTC